MAASIEDFVNVGPAIWPGTKLEVEPGDLTRFAPMGTGLVAPLVMLPWDDLSTVMSRGSYYGLHPHATNAFLDAPITEEGGGTIYFDSQPERSGFNAVLRLMGVYDAMTTYASFVAAADDPPTQRFLIQLRIVGASGLSTLYAATGGEEVKKYIEQPTAIGELLWKFIELQQEQWGAGYSAALDGTLGGDGDWAKEKLGFGFMIENAYHGIYRIWSRPWLVTK